MLFLGTPTSGSCLMTSGTTTTTPPHITSSPIVAPSEVLPNTAISDRPKVKSVSKKDAKNNRKFVLPTTSTSALATLPNQPQPTVSNQNVLCNKRK